MKNITVAAMYGDEVEVGVSDADTIDAGPADIKIHFYYGMDGETLYFTNQQAWALVNAIVAFLPEDYRE